VAAARAAVIPNRGTSKLQSYCVRAVVAAAPLFIGKSRTSADCVLSSAAAILLSLFVPHVRLFTRAPLIRWAA
jgi:hypothetical protein